MLNQLVRKKIIMFTSFVLGEFLGMNIIWIAFTASFGVFSLRLFASKVCSILLSLIFFFWGGGGDNNFEILIVFTFL